jgi:hypothetical protein
MAALAFLLRRELQGGERLPGAWSRQVKNAEVLQGAQHIGQALAGAENPHFRHVDDHGSTPITRSTT